jgi:hypothetical protein
MCQISAQAVAVLTETLLKLIFVLPGNVCPTTSSTSVKRRTISGNTFQFVICRRHCNAF